MLVVQIQQLIFYINKYYECFDILYWHLNRFKHVKGNRIYIAIPNKYE